jgi:hypothetical protein
LNESLRMATSRRTMNATNPAGKAALALERAVRAVKSMYPEAEVKVRRGRVIAVEGDLIRWIRYENLDRAAA